MLTLSDQNSPQLSTVLFLIEQLALDIDISIGLLEYCSSKNNGAVSESHNTNLLTANTLTNRRSRGYTAPPKLQKVANSVSERDAASDSELSLSSSTPLSRSNYTVTDDPGAALAHISKELLDIKIEEMTPITLSQTTFFLLREKLQYIQKILSVNVFTSESVSVCEATQHWENVVEDIERFNSHVTQFMLDNKSNHDHDKQGRYSPIMLQFVKLLCNDIVTYTEFDTSRISAAVKYYTQKLYLYTHGLDISLGKFDKKLLFIFPEVSFLPDEKANSSLLRCFRIMKYLSTIVRDKLDSNLFYFTKVDSSFKSLNDASVIVIADGIQGDNKQHYRTNLIAAIAELTYLKDKAFLHIQGGAESQFFRSLTEIPKNYRLVSFPTNDTQTQTLSDEPANITKLKQTLIQLMITIDTPIEILHELLLAASSSKQKNLLLAHTQKISERPHNEYLFNKEQTSYSLSITSPTDIAVLEQLTSDAETLLRVETLDLKINLIDINLCRSQYKRIAEVFRVFSHLRTIVLHIHQPDELSLLTNQLGLCEKLARVKVYLYNAPPHNLYGFFNMLKRHSSVRALEIGLEHSTEETNDFISKSLKENLSIQNLVLKFMSPNVCFNNLDIQYSGNVGAKYEDLTFIFTSVYDPSANKMLTSLANNTLINAPTLIFPRDLKSLRQFQEPFKRIPYSRLPQILRADNKDNLMQDLIMLTYKRLEPTYDKIFTTNDITYFRQCYRFVLDIFDTSTQSIPNSTFDTTRQYQESGNNLKIYLSGLVNMLDKIIEQTTWDIILGNNTEFLDNEVYPTVSKIIQKMLEWLQKCEYKPQVDSRQHPQLLSAIFETLHTLSVQYFYLQIIAKNANKTGMLIDIDTIVNKFTNQNYASDDNLYDMSRYEIYYHLSIVQHCLASKVAISSKESSHLPTKLLARIVTPSSLSILNITPHTALSFLENLSKLLVTLNLEICPALKHWFTIRDLILEYEHSRVSCEQFLLNLSQCQSTQVSANTTTNEIKVSYVSAAQRGQLVGQNLISARPNGSKSFMSHVTWLANMATLKFLTQEANHYSNAISIQLTLLIFLDQSSSTLKKNLKSVSASDDDYSKLISYLYYGLDMMECRLLAAGYRSPINLNGNTTRIGYVTTVQRTKQGFTKLYTVDSNFGDQIPNTIPIEILNSMESFFTKNMAYLSLIDNAAVFEEKIVATVVSNSENALSQLLSSYMREFRNISLTSHWTWKTLFLYCIYNQQPICLWQYSNSAGHLRKVYQYSPLRPSNTKISLNVLLNKNNAKLQLLTDCEDLLINNFNPILTEITKTRTNLLEKAKDIKLEIGQTIPLAFKVLSIQLAKDINTFITIEPMIPTELYQYQQKACEQVLSTKLYNTELDYQSGYIPRSSSLVDELLDRTMPTAIKKLLLTADAGRGKSTFCQALRPQWARKPSSHRHLWLVYLDMRKTLIEYRVAERYRTSDMITNLNGQASRADYIIYAMTSAFLQEHPYLNKLNQSQLQYITWVLSHSERHQQILYIFDSLDELISLKQIEGENKIPSLYSTLYLANNALVSTRRYFKTELKFNYDIEESLGNFNNAQRGKLIRRFIEDKNKTFGAVKNVPSHLAKIFQTFCSDEELDEATRTPIFLTTVLHILLEEICNKNQFELPHWYKIVRAIPDKLANRLLEKNHPAAMASERTLAGTAMSKLTTIIMQHFAFRMIDQQLTMLNFAQAKSLEFIAKDHRTLITDYCEQYKLTFNQTSNDLTQEITRHLLMTILGLGYLQSPKGNFAFFNYFDKPWFLQPDMIKSYLAAQHFIKLLNRDHSSASIVFKILDTWLSDISNVQKSTIKQILLTILFNLQEGENVIYDMGNSKKVSGLDIIEMIIIKLFNSSIKNKCYAIECWAMIGPEKIRNRYLEETLSPYFTNELNNALETLFISSTIPNRLFFLRTLPLLQSNELPLRKILTNRLSGKLHQALPVLKFLNLLGVAAQKLDLQNEIETCINKYSQSIQSDLVISLINNIELACPNSELGRTNDVEMTDIFAIAEKGSSEQVMALLTTHDINLNAQEPVTGLTILHKLISREGMLDALSKFTNDKRVKLEIRDAENRVPRDLAKIKVKEVIVDEALRERAASPTNLSSASSSSSLSILPNETITKISLPQNNTATSVVTNSIFSTPSQSTSSSAAEYINTHNSPSANERTTTYIGNMLATAKGLIGIK